ncbi:hypothetical protein BJ170DRAFT_723573 [Xylariales sp. AK1849]|nr:hypothetical protein BJ170DRAFT_723573 [Xylariales sp. AK1849]
MPLFLILWPVVGSGLPNRQARLDNEDTSRVLRVLRVHGVDEAEFLGRSWRGVPKFSSSKNVYQGIGPIQNSQKRAPGITCSNITRVTTALPLYPSIRPSGPRSAHPSLTLAFLNTPWPEQRSISPACPGRGIRSSRVANCMSLFYKHIGTSAAGNEGVAKATMILHIAQDVPWPNNGPPQTALAFFPNQLFRHALSLAVSRAEASPAALSPATYLCDHHIVQPHTLWRYIRIIAVYYS